MDVFSLTTLLISFGLSAIFALLGFLYANNKHLKAIATLENQREQFTAERQQLQEALSLAQSTLKTTEQTLHSREVEMGRLEQKMVAAEEDQQRLSQQLSQLQQEKSALAHELARALEERHQAHTDSQTTQTQLNAEQQANLGLQQRLSAAENQLQTLQSSYNALLAEHTEIKTTLEQKQQHFSEQFAQLEQNKKALSDSFENLANKILEEKGKSFSSTSENTLKLLLEPFEKKITDFQRRINEVNDKTVEGNSRLQTEIENVVKIGLKMSDEANSLATALKGDSQKRGAWGEAQLRKTLEMSGLVENTHFAVQSAFKNAEGANRQADFLIKLPDNQNIIIDSKVSLVAYDAAISAESEEQYQLAMNKHIAAVRSHIDDLAKKDYTNVIGMKSPNFVLMFMPIEPAYIDALKHNKDLFEYGYNKGIVLVSHTTLIPILRTVSNLWMIQQSNEQAQEISDRAGEIFNSVCLVAERLNKLGNTLGTVSNQYNDAVKAMAGQQGLYGKVERFEKLSAKVNKQLPKMETKHHDFENERLALIVEEIQEEEKPPMTALTAHT